MDNEASAGSFPNIVNCDRHSLFVIHLNILLLDSLLIKSIKSRPNPPSKLKIIASQFFDVGIVLALSETYPRARRPQQVQKNVFSDADVH